MNPTVGQQLQSERESRGISLSDVVKATHIRLNYLQELENDHPELLSSPVQARGFLRMYAEFLGLSFPSLLKQWEEADSKPAEPEIPQEPQKEIHTWVPEYNPNLPPESDEDLIQPEAAAEGEAEEKPSKFSLANLFARNPKITDLIRRRDLTTKDAASEEKKGLQVPSGSDKSPETIVLPIQSSKEIFNEIGFALRERRLALELTLSDVERFTNVKRMYLDAMEVGRFDELPSTVQGRGMLNNYAKFLAMDDTYIMDFYARALQAQRSELAVGTKRPIQPPLTVRLNIPEKWRRILNPDLILGSLFIVAMFGFILWGSSQVFRGGSPTPTEAPSISEMLQQTPSPTTEVDTASTQTAQVAATSIPGVAVIESTPTQIATVNAAPLQLYIIAHDHAYLRITVDDTIAFDGRVLPDNVYTYSGQASIQLLTGNGAALEVYFNQEYLGSLGKVGEVARVTFTEQGLSTPTPQAALAPTSTPVQDAMEADIENN